MEEIWKDIKSYEGRYQISNFGRVKSLPRIAYRSTSSFKVSEKILKSGLDKLGYERIRLGSKAHNDKSTYKVHRLVAIAFVDNADSKAEVNHRDSIKTNNRADNLEWSSRKENMQHAAKNNLMKRLAGEDNPNAKLNKKIVLEMFKLKADGIKNKEIAKTFNVGYSQTSRILSKEAWTHVHKDSETKGSDTSTG